MKTVIKGKKISGILSVLPEQEVHFDDEVHNYTFPEKQTMKLKRVMGYERHRIAKETTATSDMCCFGLDYLLQNGLIDLGDIGAIICVTLTPDRFVPHTSNVIHKSFDFSNDVICMDIMQGCCGFLMGLIESCSLVEVLAPKKVLLFNADVLSHKVSKQDRNTYPLIGDAATITLIEKDENAPDMHFILRTDSKKGDIVQIPAGGSRTPCSAKTSIMKDAGDGNVRSLDNLVMDGTGVFRFVQEDVPPLIDEILDYSCLKREDIDHYYFHQPNRFTLKKMAERMRVPEEKVPMDIVEKYGNTSGATVPMTIVHANGSRLCSASEMACLCAFGSGMTWGAVTGVIGDFDFCQEIISDC